MSFILSEASFQTTEIDYMLFFNFVVKFVFTVRKISLTVASGLSRPLVQLSFFFKIDQYCFEYLPGSTTNPSWSFFHTAIW